MYYIDCSMKRALFLFHYHKALHWYIGIYHCD